MMMSLLRCLWRAAKEWHGERRDFRLFKVFLESPDQRWKVIESATPAAGFLMTCLVRFVTSKLDTAEVRMEHTLSGPWSDVCRLTAPMSIHWHMLLWSAFKRAGGAFGGCGFPYADDEGSIPIFVTSPEKVPIKPEDDINTQMDKVKKWQNDGQTFIFTRIRPA
jgi:hypothetical protein